MGKVGAIKGTHQSGWKQRAAADSARDCPADGEL